MDGVLPDAEEAINRVTARNSEYFVTIDMSGKFFALAVAPQSREYTAFSWESTRYQFQRLLQGYLSGPVMAHTLLSSQIDTTKYVSLIVPYI